MQKIKNLKRKGLKRGHNNMDELMFIQIVDLINATTGVRVLAMPVAILSLRNSGLQIEIGHPMKNWTMKLDADLHQIQILKTN